MPTRTPHQSAQQVSRAHSVQSVVERPDCGGKSRVPEGRSRVKSTNYEALQPGRGTSHQSRVADIPPRAEKQLGVRRLGDSSTHSRPMLSYHSSSCHGRWDKAVSGTGVATPSD